MAEVHQLPGTDLLPEVAATPEPDPLPTLDDIGEEAFGLWALLQAGTARLYEMDNKGPIDADEASELAHLLRLAAKRAYAIGCMAGGGADPQA